MPFPALVIDDDPQLRKFVRVILEAEGWEVTEAESAESAFELLVQQDWGVVFCDVVMQGADGFSVLQRYLERQPKARVVLMTGHGNAAGALNATSLGAYDYLLKPFSIEDLQSLSNRLLDSLKNHKHSLVVSQKDEIHTGPTDIALVGSSEKFIEVMKLVGRVAPSDLPILLTGESGTGKEVVATAVHRRSRRVGPFVGVNCGAIPAELIEAELFGHVRGAFTGANRDRRGLWEEADGGTVFLDEITETTPSFQVKLLRVIQESEFRRVGSNQTRSVNVRVIAASNKNVQEEVSAGRFRQDLFYRLNAVSIVLPPLRDRRVDILPLVISFAERVFSKARIALTEEAFALLETYPWPGNIRELENAVVRAAALCDGTIRAQDLPEHIRNYQTEIIANQAVKDPSVGPHPLRGWPTMFEVEGSYVSRVIVHTKGNKQAAARLLDVDRKTLDRMINRHSISLIRAERSSSKVA